MLGHNKGYYPRYLKNNTLAIILSYVNKLLLLI